jgi:hypothetical protein
VGDNGFVLDAVVDAARQRIRHAREVLQHLAGCDDDRVVGQVEERQRFVVHQVVCEEDANGKVVSLVLAIGCPLLVVLLFILAAVAESQLAGAHDRGVGGEHELVDDVADFAWELEEAVEGAGGPAYGG